MPDIIAMLISERNKLNRAIEALGGEIKKAVTGFTEAKKPARQAIVKKPVSPEARARMAAAQQARWATVKATPGKRGPVKMSAEAKARISDAKKAWWAARKKGV